MIKKDISRVLTQGTAKQRVMIIAEDIAQYRLTRKGFLTDAETRALADSFKTNSEIKLYNRFIDFDKRVTHVLSYLRQLRLAHEVSIGHLTGYCLLWSEYQREEEMFNQLLTLIKDKATRKEALKLILKGSGSQPILAEVVAGEDGLITIETKDRATRKHSLEELIGVYKERALEQLKDAKALATAILEYMDEEGFNVKTYRDTVIETLEALSTDRAIMPKYSRKLTRLQFEKKEGEKADRLETVLSKYWIFPDPDTEPDRAQIDYYKNEYIKD